MDVQQRLASLVMQLQVMASMGGLEHQLEDALCDPTRRVLRT